MTDASFTISFSDLTLPMANALGLPMSKKAKIMDHIRQHQMQMKPKQRISSTVMVDGEDWRFHTVYDTSKDKNRKGDKWLVEPVVIIKNRNKKKPVPMLDSDLFI